MRKKIPDNSQGAPLPQVAQNAISRGRKNSFGYLG